MDWIEAQLDDESIFPQKLGMYAMHCSRVGKKFFGLSIDENNFIGNVSSFEL